MASQNLTIRRLVRRASIALLLVGATSIALLVGVAFGIEQSLTVVARDTRGAAVADDIKVTVLLYQRLSNLAWVNPNAQVLEARGDQSAKLRSLLAELPQYTGSALERALVQELARVLPAYLDRRQALDEQAPDLETVLAAVAPLQGQLLEAIEALRAENDRQVGAATAAAQWALRLSAILAVVAIVGLGVVLALIAGAVGRFLTRPIRALHGAMAAFGQGDLSARGVVDGTWEVRELARMFNDMAATQEQQQRARMEFLAGVAHDLKNPMSTLKNGLYLLHMEDASVDRARMRSMLDGQIDLLVRMVDDFLDAARIEAGELELRCIDFDVRHLTRDLVQAYSGIVPARRLVLQNDDQRVMIHADPLRIEQVLRNLLSNAIKYSAEGEIILRTSVDGAQAVLEVQDHGVGIAPDDLARIFLPFKRRHLNVAPGVGLGLSVVRRLVVAHGGSIEVDSEIGYGSTFRVRLPALAEEVGVEPTRRGLAPRRL